MHIQSIDRATQAFGGGVGSDEYAQVTKEFLMKPFKQLGGSTEYILSYSDLGVQIDVEGGIMYLSVQPRKRGLGSYITLFIF